ncbi:MAG: bacillithiol biosynthesis cysteine-adding enzyme BshC [Ignavibacteria bacterium]|nr:bacillithiol biosynthesis cysteine-adding enzyme BshC [Ignavibacteria bacterium]
MFKVIDFNLIPGFSRLFLDFISKDSFFKNRFRYADDLFQDENHIEEILNKTFNRDFLFRLFSDSNRHHLHSKQKENIELTTKDNTLFVVTGQQPGIFGGPLYAFYKSLTAISLAEILSYKFKNYNFVPIFWIEDNDHDCREAFEVALFDLNYHLFDCKKLVNICETYTSKVVSSIEFGSEFDGLKENLLNFFKLDSKQSSFEIIDKCISSGISLTDSFYLLLNYLLGNLGLLFLRASVCRSYGAFTNVVVSEIENVGYSFTLIESANRSITEKGYTLQAKASYVNLFFHEGDERYKIEYDSNEKVFVIKGRKYEKAELFELANANPERFSPNVLLRPICQDSFLPSVAVVLGPSEIGYYTQLRELFSWHRITMPAVIPRHSITLIPRDFEKILHSKDLYYFFQKKEDFENSIFNAFRNKGLIEKFEALEAQLKDIFHEMKIMGCELDKSLELSAEAHLKKSLNSFDSFRSKILSAERRNILKNFANELKLNQIIFPKNSLQERIIGSLFILLVNEKGKIFENLQQIVNNPSDSHYILLF